MRQVGIVATSVTLLAALAALAMAVRSYPDVQRYLKIRAM